MLDLWLHEQQSELAKWIVEIQYAYSLSGQELDEEIDSTLMYSTLNIKLPSVAG